MSAFLEEPSRLAFGKIYAHVLTQAEAIERIVDRAASGLGGYVVTPNVDHICLAQEQPRLREAYGQAFLAVADGQPLLWMAKARGKHLPEKVSGSDLIVPLLTKAAEKGLRTYFLGATTDVCTEAAEKLRALIPGLQIVGWSSPMYNPDSVSDEVRVALADLAAAKPDLVLVALGNPKQEYLLHDFQAQYHPAVGLAIGASLDFLAGRVDRAPTWMSEKGLEWAYRLYKEPKRLWRRYLVRDRAILGIFLRDLRSDKRKKAKTAQS
jgi:N-acetylglucosaminyldiphosphoundecaprenol N-acetyl-beta-D-mannosaminyltransferase